MEPWPGRHSPDAPIQNFQLVETAGAPLVEYSREAFGIADRKVHGRIYWNRDFAVYQGLPYDQRAFAKWYDHGSTTAPEIRKCSSQRSRRGS